MNDETSRLPNSAPEIVQVPEGVPTLEFVRSQREQLIADLRLSSSELPVEGYECVRQIFQKVTDLVKQHPGGTIPDFFSEHAPKMETIFGNFSSYCELPLFDTVQMREEVLGNLDNQQRQKIIDIVQCFFVIKVCMFHSLHWTRYSDAAKMSGFNQTIKCREIAVEKQLLSRATFWLAFLTPYTDKFVGDVCQGTAALREQNKQHFSLMNIDLDGLVRAQQVEISKGIIDRGRHIQFLTLSKWAANNQRDAVDAFNLLLCQSDMSLFEDALGVKTRYKKHEKDYVFPALTLWMKDYFDLLIRPGTSINTIFRYIFQIAGPIYDKGFNITQEVRKSSFIPEHVKVDLESYSRIYKKALRDFQKRVVDAVPPPTVDNPAVEALLITTGSTVSSTAKNPEPEAPELTEIPAPAMNFAIDTATGVVQAPEGWILPEGCTISWTVCYKGSKGREIPQPTHFSIREGVLDISYREENEEVYGKQLYIIVTLTAPNGSAFPTGTSITSSELSFYRKAPEVQTMVPDAPQNISAQSGGFGEIIVSFDAPVSNGGSPIMSYTVIASNGQKVTGANSPIMMKGLPGGKMYTFTVTAKNHKGESNPSAASEPIVATLEAPTFNDTQAAWEIALGNPSDGLWYSIDEDNNIVVTLDDSLVGDRDNPALDNLVYRTIVIDPHGVFDIGDILGEELSTSLRAYAGQIRQDIIEKEERRIERDKQNTIYHTLQDELHPCMEVLRGLAGTELATEKLNGATLSQTFREKGVPMTNTVVRKKEKPAYKDILTLNFTERDVTATYSDGVVTFSGQGYTQGLEGIQRAYHDFREVITELGKFLFLTESQKSKRLQRLRAQRQALVGSFINNLKSPKKTVNAQLIAVSDAMLVPSYMGDSVAHAGFPPDGSPDVRYVVVTRETLEAEYEKLRISIHGSGDAVKNKSISIMCLVRTGHIHINGDTGGDNKPYNVETVAANIESLRNSPQGRALLWDRIIATYGGTGTKIINGALKVLEEVKSIYDNILPTDEDTREEFIDDYLDELCREGILISYVRFSAVTIKEVREGLKAQE